jgi:tripartite-type tricarboxylate transporter receptor subunit TctC
LSVQKSAKNFRKPLFKEAMWLLFLEFVMRRRSIISLAATSLVAHTAAFSQAVPALDKSKPIKLIVPFAAGGTTDIVARLLAKKFTTMLEHPVMVENKPGAGGSAGTDMIAKAQPDGYTLGLSTISALACNPATNAKTPYNPEKDFTYLGQIASSRQVLSANPKTGFKSISDLLAFARKNPGKLNWASSGQNGIGHLMLELFKFESKTFITHIPYAGAAPAVAGVASGQGADLVFDQLSSSQGPILSGKLTPLAVTGAKRLPDPLGQLKTFNEQGMPTLNIDAWYGLIAPASLPKQLAMYFEAALIRAGEDFAFRGALDRAGADPLFLSGQKQKDEVLKDLSRFSKLADDLGLRKHV